MHYLGLDHIGHNCGPFCHHLITPKLMEMDEIVQKIFTALQKVFHVFQRRTAVLSPDLFRKGQILLLSSLGTTE